MITKHTPGPWAVVGLTHVLARGATHAEANYICLDVGPRWPSKGHECAEANARLIAATPKLLTACGMALDVLLADGYAESSYPVMQLRAALTEALEEP
jgi:hypothetical protein